MLFITLIFQLLKLFCYETNISIIILSQSNYFLFVHFNRRSAAATWRPRTTNSIPSCNVRIPVVQTSSFSFFLIGIYLVSGVVQSSLLLLQLCGGHRRGGVRKKENRNKTRKNGKKYDKKREKGDSSTTTLTAARLSSLTTS